MDSLQSAIFAAAQFDGVVPDTFTNCMFPTRIQRRVRACFTRSPAARSTT